MHRSCANVDMCSKVYVGGGANVGVRDYGITRSPCLRFRNGGEAWNGAQWLNDAANLHVVQEAFNSTSSVGRLRTVTASLPVGCDVHVRLVAFSGDAMGMNMVSKGSKAAMEVTVDKLGELGWPAEVLAISGNTCTDKKPSGKNWALGRGKSVFAHVRIPCSRVPGLLSGADPVRMVEVHRAKNLEGSALAGSVGGYNAHAANIVAAMFIACGQDPAHVVEGSHCMTSFRIVEGDGGETDDKMLEVSVSMPCLMVGTVGGGTGLPPQKSALNCMNVAGSSAAGVKPGTNALAFAECVATAVLAGEISLLAAISKSQLVSAHMTHNRAKK